MSLLRAAIIGAGRPRRTKGATGFGMAYNHAKGFEAAEDCELVAVADTRRENAEAFARDHAGVAPYESYEEMLKREKPDIVSICLWTHLHAPVAFDCMAAGVKAIHCEKPMAATFGDARRMVEAADARGVQLTFNHQMRFGQAYREAKRLLDAGEIGKPLLFEASFNDLLDSGTHSLDMIFYYNDQTPAEWVIGQIDLRSDRGSFGVRREDQSITQFRFKNGAYGLLITGEGADVVGCMSRIVGTEGVIEVGWGHPPDLKALRLRRESRAGWEEPRIEQSLSGPDMLVGALTRAMLEVIDAFRTGRRSELDCHNALQATEIVFATYESSRRRARVDLPLTIDDSPFLSMLEEGVIGPQPQEKAK